MAQEEGFEPPTSRLTAGCSTTELLLNRLIEAVNLAEPIFFVQIGFSDRFEGGLGLRKGS